MFQLIAINTKLNSDEADWNQQEIETAFISTQMILFMQVFSHYVSNMSKGMRIHDSFTTNDEKKNHFKRIFTFPLKKFPNQ